MSEDAADTKAKPSVAQMFKALADMFKSIPSEKLDGIRDVEDLWTRDGEHSLPGRDEIGPFGPAEPMSGRGASKMVREYSSPAPQSSMVDLYARMENYMQHMGKAVSTLGGVVGDVLKTQKVTAELLDGFIKAEAEREDAAKKAAAPVFGDETYIGNALKRFEKARKSFRKSEFEDEGAFEIRRGLLDEAANALKAARALLTKAEDAAEDRTGATIDKAMDDVKELSARVTKALAEITKAEEDKKDEDRKEKEAEDAKKAEPPVAEKAEDPVSETVATETPAVAEKAEDPVQGKLEQAIKAMHEAAEGNAVMQTSLKEFMDLFSKASRFSGNPPDFHMVKSTTAVGADAAEARVNAAREAGILVNMSDSMLADSLINRQRAAEAGSYPKEKFEDDLVKAPDSVRKLFAA